MFLNEFIKFSITYKKFIKNKFNNDLKMYIWNLYKKQVAYDIIKQFLHKIIQRCDDCYRTNWKINPENVNTIFKYNFYKVPACNNPCSESTDTSCCEKTVCSFDCNFNITCSNCKFNYYFQLPHSNYDQGWNPVEGLKIIKSDCPICNKINIIKLAWEHKKHDMLILGKQLSSKRC